MVADTFDAPALNGPGTAALFDNQIPREWIATAAAAAYLKPTSWEAGSGSGSVT